jgi:hypothetical protein
MKLHGLAPVASFLSLMLHLAEAQPAFALEGYGAASATLSIPA